MVVGCIVSRALFVFKPSIKDKHSLTISKNIYFNQFLTHER